MYLGVISTTENPSGLANSWGLFSLLVESPVGVDCRDLVALHKQEQTNRFLQIWNDTAVVLLSKSKSNMMKALAKMARYSFQCKDGIQSLGYFCHEYDFLEHSNASKIKLKLSNLVSGDTSDLKARKELRAKGFCVVVTSAARLGHVTGSHNVQDSDDLSLPAFARLVDILHSHNVQLDEATSSNAQSVVTASASRPFVSGKKTDGEPKPLFSSTRLE
ncbi:hypothetical protein LJR030_000689 [Rhizobium sp. LjRoot30]|uniref:hypothetical protein n=1 Tax=Rhizobium sp. LjRoot30 TaxID=3342320 RepID=UPI003ECE147A